MLEEGSTDKRNEKEGGGRCCGIDARTLRRLLCSLPRNQPVTIFGYNLSTTTGYAMRALTTPTIGTPAAPTAEIETGAGVTGVVTAVCWKVLVLAPFAGAIFTGSSDVQSGTPISAGSVPGLTAGAALVTNPGVITGQALTPASVQGSLIISVASITAIMILPVQRALMGAGLFGSGTGGSAPFSGAGNCCGSERGKAKAKVKRRECTKCTQRSDCSSSD